MPERAEQQQAHSVESVIQISCGDFQRNLDGSWTVVKQIDLVGPSGSQRLIPNGRRFAKGQMFLFGIDLAAFLEKQCGE